LTRVPKFFFAETKRKKDLFLCLYQMAAHTALLQLPLEAELQKLDINTTTRILRRKEAKARRKLVVLLDLLVHNAAGMHSHFNGGELLFCCAKLPSPAEQKQQWQMATSQACSIVLERNCDTSAAFFIFIYAVYAILHRHKRNHYKETLSRSLPAGRQGMSASCCYCSVA